MKIHLHVVCPADVDLDPRAGHSCPHHVPVSIPLPSSANCAIQRGAVSSEWLCAEPDARRYGRSVFAAVLCAPAYGRKSRCGGTVA